MADIINGYELLSPLHNQDAGFSRWTYVKKEGKEYFLKEFLNPVYPDESSLSYSLREIRIQDCKDFEKEKKKIYEKINEISDGNLVRIEEFFRSDSHYYIVTPKIDAEEISFEEISEFPLEDRIMLCKTILHSMMQLHEAKIVHADIKGNNILITKTKLSKLVGKIIDFDCSFFEENQPADEDDLGGDQVYLAPEAYQFIDGQEVELTGKIDVFALGLLFHQYLTGNLPTFDESEFYYAHEAVLEGEELILSDELPAEIAKVIKAMLMEDPNERISCAQAFEEFKNYGNEIINIDSNEIEINEEPTIAINDEPTEIQNASENPWFSQAGDL